MGRRLQRAGETNVPLLPAVPMQSKIGWIFHMTLPGVGLNI